MHQHISSDPNVHKKIKPEQLSQIISAIIDGRYSWACVLLLRAISENPLHYIPYRTYNRLLKEELQVGKLSKNETSDNKLSNQLSEIGLSGESPRKRLSKITDLAYLEVVGEQHRQIHGGGNLSQWLNRTIREYNFRKIDLALLKDSSSFDCN